MSNGGTVAIKLLMSALGHKRTLRDILPMSALPPKADIETGPRYQLRRDNSGSFATLAAIRRASSRAA
jgi:hypothetical protein